MHCIFKMWSHHTFVQQHCFPIFVMERPSYHSPHLVSPFHTMCNVAQDGFNDLCIVTPKSLSSSVLINTSSFIEYSYYGLLYPKCFTLHLFTLNFIYYSSDHSINLVKSVCRIFCSSTKEILAEIFVSSANFSILLDTVSSITYLWLIGSQVLTLCPPL